MSEWDNIQGVDGWTSKLSELLAEAERVAQEQDFQVRFKTATRLKDFILHSAPNTAEIRELDDLANNARQDLLRITIEERIAKISERTGKLAQLTKQFKEHARAAEESAASIRLDRAKGTVDSLTGSVSALQDFRRTLKEGEDDEILKSVDRVVGSLQKLRSEVEKDS